MYELFSELEVFTASAARTSSFVERGDEFVSQAVSISW